MIDITARMEMCNYILCDVNKAFEEKPNVKKIIVPVVVDVKGDGVAITNHLRNHGYKCTLTFNKRWFDRFIEIKVQRP